MTTTRNIPTEPGYYWHRDIDEGCGEAFEWEPKHVTRMEPPHQETLLVDFEAAAEVAGEWGPRIPEPGEKEAKAEGILEAYTRSLQDQAREREELRDIFAGCAMNGLITSGRYQLADETNEKVAKDAYWYADAMMAEKEKQNA